MCAHCGSAGAPGEPRSGAKHWLPLQLGGGSFDATFVGTAFVVLAVLATLATRLGDLADAIELGIAFALWGAFWIGLAVVRFGQLKRLRAFALDAALHEELARRRRQAWLIVIGVPVAALSLGGILGTLLLSAR